MTTTPPALDAITWSSPDDDFSAVESLFETSFELEMMSHGSNDSSPVDFAFGPPPTEGVNDGFKAEVAKTPYHTINPYHHLMNMNTYGLSSASSFSSASGSVAGSSFSSADALPAISTNFARPSTAETRRPATAGGVLQSRSPFVGFMPSGRREATLPESIDENGETLFSDPFEQGEREQRPVDEVDPHYLSDSTFRRSSEPQSNLPMSWAQGTMNPPPVPSLHSSNFTSISPNAISDSRTNYTTSRPQTSDGLPSYSGMSHGISLPSARTIVPHLPQQSPPSYGYNTYRGPPLPPRDNRIASMGDVSLGHSSFPNRGYSLDASGASRSAFNPSSSMDSVNSDMQFVALGGPTPKKRPRRRFDEIERLYTCGHAGCEKSYGTLNHLNAHVAMQKHGEKRLPSEFKDMRKAWRKKKRESNAASTSSKTTSSNPQWSGGRNSIGSSSSESPDERRDSNASSLPLPSHRGSIQYNQNFSWTPNDHRPNTGSSTSSFQAQPHPHPAQYIHPNTMINPVQPIRRPSAPGYLTMPGNLTQGFRHQDGDVPTPTQMNPYPIPGVSGYAPQPQLPVQGQGEYQFSMLSSSVPVGGLQQGFGAQFAFQR